jgi:hypothetical protein
MAKALMKYNESLFLVEGNLDEIDYEDLFSQVNQGRWADECQSKDWIKKESELICWMNQESEILSVE